MKVKFVIAVLVALICLPLFAGDFKIGAGTSTEYYVPMYGYANYNWSKILYTNAELQAQGMTTATTIKKIAFYVSNVTSYTTLNQTIYMGYNYNTSYSGLTSYPSSYTGYTQVYNGPITWTSPGWFEITLTTPYTYDPTLTMSPSLEILWENRDGSALSPYPLFRYTSSTSKCVYKSGSSYPTLSSGTLYSNRPNIWLMSDPTAIPPAASATLPLNAAVSIEINSNLGWLHNGGQPDSYKVYLGTDNPPTNVVNGASVTTNSFDIPGYLQYGTIYYWKVVPHNSFGDAASCPIWSFTTRADPTIYTFPWTEAFDGTFPSTNWETHAGILTDPMVFGADGLCKWEQDDWLNITGTNKAAKLELQSSGYTGWLVTPPLNITSDRFELQFDLAFLKWNQTPTGTPPALTGTDDRFVVLIGDGFTWSTANILREWNNTGSLDVLNSIPVSGERITISLPVSRGTQRIAFYAGSTVMNADNDLMLDNMTIQEKEVDLPVELTSFTAITFDANTVSIQWSSQTETNMMGYNVYRNTSSIVNSADQINSNIVAATNTSQTHNYSLQDTELTMDTTYYYWLEAINLDGTNHLYGPVSVLFHVDDPETPNPNVPTATQLYTAYPNPFNPSTILSFNLKTASHAILNVYNVKGELVKCIYDGNLNSGIHSWNWDGTDTNGNSVGSGIYFYRLINDKFTQTKKMMLMK